MPMSAPWGQARVDLIALTRTAGNTVTARLKIVNIGKKRIKLLGSLRERTGAQNMNPNVGEVLAASGVGLLDTGHRKVYMPLHLESESKKCVCSSTSRKFVEPGGGFDVYATFPSPPAGVEKVAVMVPFAFPFLDVPIADDPVTPLNGQIDPAGAELKKPRIIDVQSFVQSLEKSVRGNGSNRSVGLSADVLFAVDKAELTPEADRLLRELAEQIDASKDTAIEVDGHADNTGTDAINRPLSERRAKAVVKRLTSLVTRKGITYKAEGHGSDDPVATNGTEEGRRKNRRVTVTFTKPTTSASSTVGGEPYKMDSSTVLGSGTFEAAEAEGLKVEVNSLRSHSSGLAILVWTLRNTGKKPRDFSTRFEWELYTHKDWPPQVRGGTTGGVLLYDKAAQARYYPLNLESGRCLCSNVYDHGPIAPGESIVLYDIYEVPANSGPLEMQIPWDKLPDASVKGLRIK